MYTPTFRDYAINTSFSNAIPNFEKLKETAEKNNLLIIFKMHYLDEEDAYYQKVCEMYKKSEHFIFWDNKYDVYEIFDKIDAAIIDYSSIYYDMLTKDIKFIRYIYDYDQYLENRPLLYDYKENTSGEIVETFDELINTLENIDEMTVDDNEQDKGVYFGLVNWQEIVN